MKYTGSQWTKPVNMLPFATYAAGAEVFTSGFDCSGFDQALIIVSAGTFAGGATLALEIDAAPDNATFTAIPGATFSSAVLIAASTPNIWVADIRLEQQARYLRLGYTVGTANALFGVILLLIDAKYKPPTQVNPVQFQV